MRVTVGRADALTTEQARLLAKSRLGELAKGRDLNRANKRNKVRSITLEASFTAFCAARSALRPRTIEDYRSLIDRHLADWRAKPWASITRGMILERHRLIGEQNGKRSANNTMKSLRSVLTFCRSSFRDPATDQPMVEENPVRVLSEVRAWYPERRKEDYLTAAEIGPWWEAVQSLGNDIQRDYLHALLLTGARGGEMSRLRWTDVDLKNRAFAIRDSKNGETLRLPLCSYLQSMLQRRAEGAHACAYVFPASSKRGDGTHISCVNRLLYRVSEASGVPMRTRHGLRRSFVTIAEYLGVGTFTAKRLLGHVATASGDVTAGYIQFSVESLRSPVDRIADFILRAAGVIKSADVIPFEARAISD